jgi:hypothetical protein
MAARCFRTPLEVISERHDVIVSASYRTDIPAFYARWFLRRLSAGSCSVANPYGSGTYNVSLLPGEVDGFVFWTRNIKPLLPGLDAVRRIAPFVVQFTVTGYLRTLDASVIPRMWTAPSSQGFAAL